MSNLDNIRKMMQTLKCQEQELANLRSILSNKKDKCSKLSEECEDLKTKNPDLIDLQQELNKVKEELTKAHSQREKLQKEENDVQEQEDELQENLEKETYKFEELNDLVAAGEADADRNGSRLAEYQKMIITTDQEKRGYYRALENNRKELSEGQKDREEWGELLLQARSLLLVVEATKQLLEENGSLMKENNYSKRYRNEFGKMEQLRLLCQDDRSYLRQ